ncbi:MFS transporter [Microbacterium protaetiae]|uniref:MFS transporter n=1 Tax=Microbacterium protaetiae TaxID=2509458 RepID=A0A4P6EEL7_9MICO|nr:MFS transporter [Microbacterium protaetiae]QAY59529.1 MFS transporter [Microbacterium protaetiae]
MALTFSVLQLLNEVGTMMAIPLYGSMSTELVLSPGQATWALMSTTIFGAATIALLSKAGDVYGHRRLMVVSVVGITVGFVISAVAANFIVLVIGRALTGTMAGQALCVGILNARLSVRDRTRAVAVIAGGQAIGIFTAFLLGGVIIELGGTWRTAFWTGGVLTLLSLVAFLIWGKDSDARRKVAGTRHRIEVGGVLLLGLGLTLLCVGIAQSTTWGVTSPTTIALVIGGVIVLLAAFRVESKAKNPLLEVRLLRGRNLTPAYLVFVTLGVCGMLLYNLTLTLLALPGGALGAGFGFTPFQSAFVFLPMTVAGLVAAKSIPILVRRLSAGAVLVIGGMLLMAAFATLRFGYGSLIAIAVAILMFGFGYTTLLTTALSVITAEAPKETAAGTASLYVSVALASSSLGSAIFAALEAANSDVVEGVAIPTAGLFDIGYAVAGAAVLVAIVCGLVIRPTKLIEAVTAH